MNVLLYVDGFKPKPIGLFKNAYNIDNFESDQSSILVTSITSCQQDKYCIGSKENISQIKSTTGFPKGSNSYGDGALILGIRKSVLFSSKVGQRTYSMKRDAVYDGTPISSKLEILNNGKYKGLYKIISSEEMIHLSYSQIKSKQGNMTPGVDNMTLEGISESYIKSLSNSLKDESFQFKPVKRTFIPKANGKMRP
ncbi:MAG: hypothetical protein NWQ38_01425 [Cellulophaga sp.]|nr:hypothetical protein [Cellulophaga sp.]